MYTPGRTFGFIPGFNFISVVISAATTVWSQALSSSSWTVGGTGLSATKTTASAGSVKASKALTTGRAYFECKLTARPGITRIGVANTSYDVTALPGTGSVVYNNNGVVFNESTNVGTFTTYDVNDIIGVDVNRTSNTVAFYKNGTLITTVSISFSGDLSPICYTGALNTVVEFNAGQNPFTPAVPSGSAPWG